MLGLQAALEKTNDPPRRLLQRFEPVLEFKKRNGAAYWTIVQYPGTASSVSRLA
jgi:hypothetical protein